uniref:Protein kinase domain-containing protein n=1 Tax=Compsopogon caeruleus TaxID=31354 RepID=A0A7S1XFE0_9RHOD
MYIILCGYPPFFYDETGQLFRAICSGKFSFPDSEWSQVSQSAKDLISKMLVVDPAGRTSAEAALRHQWFRTSQSKENLSNQHLANLNARRKIRGGILAVQAGVELLRLLKAREESQAQSQVRFNVRHPLQLDTPETISAGPSMDGTGNNTTSGNSSEKDGFPSRRRKRSLLFGDRGDALQRFGSTVQDLVEESTRVEAPSIPSLEQVAPDNLKDAKGHDPDVFRRKVGLLLEAVRRFQEGVGDRNSDSPFSDNPERCKKLFPQEKMDSGKPSRGWGSLKQSLAIGPLSGARGESLQQTQPASGTRTVGDAVSEVSPSIDPSQSSIGRQMGNQLDQLSSTTPPRLISLLSHESPSSDTDTTHARLISLKKFSATVGSRNSEGASLNDDHSKVSTPVHVNVQDLESDAHPANTGSTVTEASGALNISPGAWPGSQRIAKPMVLSKNNDVPKSITTASEVEKPIGPSQVQREHPKPEADISSPHGTLNSPPLVKNQETKEKPMKKPSLIPLPLSSNSLRINY